MKYLILIFSLFLLCCKTDKNCEQFKIKSKYQSYNEGICCFSYKDEYCHIVYFYDSCHFYSLRDTLQ